MTFARPRLGAFSTRWNPNMNMNMRLRLAPLLPAALCAVLVGLTTAGLPAAAQDEVTEIHGAGATFPYPVYAKWADVYNKQTGVKLNYQSIGSGGGIKQIEEKTVDFGASDAPLEAKELDANGLLQFPMVIGGVVPVVNIDGVAADQLKLTGQQLADIFQGKITKWSDPALAGNNPGLKLPDQHIIVVHRSDGSGTTWIFTNYLSKVSSQWAEKVGNDKAVSWPAGVGGKGNEGVASYVTRVKGSIGYVEYAYALQNKMADVQMQNTDGHFVSPTAKNFQAAAANADWKNAPGFYMVLTNQPGADSWPISGASFILMHKVQANPAAGLAVLKFFDWAYRNGADMAEKLDYVPIPVKVFDLVEQNWGAHIKDGQGKAVWTPAMAAK